MYQQQTISISKTNNQRRKKNTHTQQTPHISYEEQTAIKNKITNLVRRVKKYTDFKYIKKKFNLFQIKCLLNKLNFSKIFFYYRFSSRL